MSLRFVRILQPVRLAYAARFMASGERGSGVGQGGGSGGSIVDAGGAFGKRGAAMEEQYFRKLSSEQLDHLKKSFEDEIEYHEDEIEGRQESIERHKRKIEELQKISGSAKK